MPCCGDREKDIAVSVEERWDYINLDDFSSESCMAPFSYVFLWIFLLISVAVYAVDTFTAVNLLIFSHWAGQIKPAIPFEVSRWIFAVCIIVSFALLAIRWLRAIRAIRSGSIAKSYLNSLAVRTQSTRMGKQGRGWRRFLVFAEMTKSKKGAENVALFAYFAFESWMNVVFADGPRQVVNAITLYSVMQMDLLPGGKNATDHSGSGASQFFGNIKILADDSNQRAVVLFGMLFTLVIWVFSVIKLALAVILYLIFLFHHIPAEDGTLRAYCRRKINRRLQRIVSRKVNKALAKGVALQDRAPTQPDLGMSAKPTLPSVAGKYEDKTPLISSLSRSTTQTTLPLYTSRPGTATPGQKPSLPDLSWSTEKPPLSRTTTQSSAYAESAYSGSTAVSGYSPLDRSASPAPPVPPLPNTMTPAARSYTPMSRPGTTPPRGAPTPVNGSARATPAPGYRNQNEGYNPFNANSPQDSRTGTPFRSYTPANDPYARSLTQGAAMSPEDSRPPRTFTPASHGAGPRPPAAAINTGYGGRSYTPAAQSAGPRPPPSVGSPASHTARSYTPFDRVGSPQQQRPGYAAFDPSMNSRTPAPRTQTPASPTYRPYSPSTTTPSNDYHRQNSHF